MTGRSISEGNVTYRMGGGGSVRGRGSKYRRNDYISYIWTNMVYFYKRKW